MSGLIKYALYVAIAISGVNARAFGGEAHALPLEAEPVFSGITNSIIMTWLGVGVIIIFCKIATKEMRLVPSMVQNFCEWVVETIYNFLGGMLGDRLNKRTFWYMGSVFFFILINNYLGLLPGVGTIGTEIKDAHGHSVLVPWLRSANADLNLTAAMALCFAVLWFYWAISEIGLVAFIKHIFSPPGKFHGAMLIIMSVVFIFIGVMELISIAVRPVALTFRLYGNIYGGEQTIGALMSLAPDWLAFLPSLPYFFMELMVGLVQAMVFMMLSAIFVKLICTESGH